MALYEKLKVRKRNLQTGSSRSLGAEKRDARRTNLPIPLTSFIGREKEVDEIVQLLHRNRLVTLLWLRRGWEDQAGDPGFQQAIGQIQGRHLVDRPGRPAGWSAGSQRSRPGGGA